MFKQYDFVYAKHCYTALQLAVKEDKEDLSYFFIEKGIKQGLTSRFIENAPIVKDITSSNRWNKFKLEKYDSLRKIYLNNINLKLRDEIERLSSIDQHYTNNVNNSKFVNYLIKSRIWKKEVKKLVEKKLKIIIQKYGFPGEKLIGIDEVNISYLNFSDKNEKELITKGKRSLFCVSAQYMLIHYFSRPYPNFNNLLKKELKNGNLEPYQYAIISDFQAKYGKKYKNEGYYNQWHRDVDKDKRSEINKRRLSIGLETFEDLRIKESRNYKISKEIEKGNYEHIKIYTIWGGY